MESIENKIAAILKDLTCSEPEKEQMKVQIVSCQSGILKVRLTGKCSSCPSALLSAENEIADRLRETVPEIKQVILLNGVSDSLLEQARNLMGHRKDSESVDQ